MKAARSDVLIVGGGIAGCFAALSASKTVRTVTLLEKSTVRRGGAVGPGMDQIMLGIGGPIPGAPSLEDAFERIRSDEVTGNVASFSSLVDPNIELYNARDSYDRLLDWESFEPKIREDDGGYRVTFIPERFFFTLNVRGVNLKVKFGEGIRGIPNVTVVERTMGVDLITEGGRVVGAYGLNTRTGEITAFLAKATVLTSGIAARQFIETPESLFMTWHCPNNIGDGQAMAYRAGAELINAEFGFLDYASCREGGGVFGLHPFDKMPILKNRLGERIIKTREDNDKRVFLMAKEVAEGRGPLYFDCSEMPEDEFKVLERNLDHEYPITRKWFKQRGLNIRRDPVPIQLVPAGLYVSVLSDENGATSLPGLFAGGDTMAGEGSLAGATLTGYRAGLSAAAYSHKASEPELDSEKASDIEGLVKAPLGKDGGGDPIDLEEAVRGLKTDYVGYYKSEGMMLKGLDLLLNLKRIYLPELGATDAHGLVRCMEVRNLFDVSEMHIRASLARKETRFARMGMMHHIRLDYPERDPTWRKWIVVKKRGEEMTLSTREVPRIKEEVRKVIEEEIARRKG